MLTWVIIIHYNIEVDKLALSQHMILYFNMLVMLTDKINMFSIFNSTCIAKCIVTKGVIVFAKITFS